MYRGRNDRSYRGGQRSNFDNRKNTPQRPQMKKEIGSSPSPSTISPATAQARPAAAQARPAAAQAQARPNQAREPERAEQVSPAVKPIVKDPPKESRSYPDTKTDQNKSAERSSSSMSSGDRDRRHHQSRDHNERSRDGSRNRDGSGHAGRDEGREQQSHSQDEEQMSTEVSSGRKPEKKFTQRCRLFVGNLTPETTEEDFKILFDKYGEISEVFLNKSKGFGFIRLDTRYNAEAAKAELDGTMRKGRMLRVRFATHGAALKVKNIPTCVSNELLEQAFSQFGVVERAVVIVDDRGRPTSEGIVEFARKPGAQNALTRIKEGVFLLTSTPNPISVEPLEQRDEEDGLPEKNIPKNQAYHQERENAPRFGAPGSFEFTWGNRWKALEEAEKMQRDRLEKQIQDNREKLEGEIEMAKHEHQAMLMRQELMRRQDELNRHEENLLRAQEQRRQKDEQRRREEALMKQQQEELLRRRQQQQQQQQQGGAMSLGQQDMRRQQQSEDVRHANLRGVGNGGQQPRIQLMQNLAEHQGNGTKTQIPQGMQMRGAGGHQGPMNQTSAMAGQANQGLLANPSMQALVQGLGGGNANVGRMGQGQAQTIQSRPSRFDQPPQNMGGRGQPGPGGMGVPQQGGGSYGGGTGGPRPLEEIRTRPPPSLDRRDMDRRERHEDYMAKRPRRY